MSDWRNSPTRWGAGVLIEESLRFCAPHGVGLQILYVKGIDLSPYEIQAAQQRFDDAIHSKPGEL